MAARNAREKKTMERFAPPEAKADADKNAIYEGSGSMLADVPIVPVNLNKIDADHDLLKAFHSFLYGAVGKKTVRKKNIRSFSGFPEDDDRDARAKKLTESKKWTVAALKDLCTLLGLDKSGGKSDVVDRVVDFLTSPDPAASKGPVPKKPKKVVKKRKSVGKGGKKAKKVKREVKPRPLGSYMVFVRENRAKVLEGNADLKATEVTVKLGEMWRECSDAQKEKYKQQGIKEFEKKQAMAKADNDEEEEEDVEEEGGEESADEVDGDDDEE